MIAPLQETNKSSEMSGKGLPRARRLVAATLLEEHADAENASPRSALGKIWARWKIWALLAIVAAMVAIWMV